MNQKELIEYISNKHRECIDLVKTKNSDYADVEKDAFKNFRSSEIIGINYKKAIILRILDKISRVSNLLEKENAVKDEPVELTCVDISNYILILSAAIENERRK